MNYFNTKPHAGHCCGIFTIYNFHKGGPERQVDRGTYGDSFGEGILPIKGPNPDGTGRMVAPQYSPKDSLKTHGEVFKDYFLNVIGGSRGRLFEAVLNDDQVETGWEKFLLNEIGFNKVNSFKNKNSGNMCHIYHFHDDQVNL